MLFADLYKYISSPDDWVQGDCEVSGSVELHKRFPPLIRHFCLEKNSTILDFLKKKTKKTFSPDRNQNSAERFPGDGISIIVKIKKCKFWFTVAKGHQNVSFTKMAKTRERNEILSPNLVHMCKSSI